MMGQSAIWFLAGLIALSAGAAPTSRSRYRSEVRHIGQTECAEQHDLCSPLTQRRQSRSLDERISFLPSIPARHFFAFLYQRPPPNSLR
jgi:hypothetical protein